MLFRLAREPTLLLEAVGGFVKKRGAVVAGVVLGLFLEPRLPPHIRIPVALVVGESSVEHPRTIGLDHAELATHFVERGKASD